MNCSDNEQVLFVYCNFLVLLSTTVCSQNINKQNVYIADETLTDYSFLSRYHYTKSENYLKRRYRIRHWIPMFIGTPCTILLYNKDDIEFFTEFPCCLGHPVSVSRAWLGIIKTDIHLYITLSIIQNLIVKLDYMLLHTIYFSLTLCFLLYHPDHPYYFFIPIFFFFKG